MQSIAPASTANNPNQHSTDEVLAALRGVAGSRYFTFRYDLLSSSNVKIDALDSVISCTIDQNWLADVKRTARFKLRDTGAVDFLQDRIQPWIRLHLPPYGVNDWVEWPQGVFLTSSPSRVIDTAGLITRDVTAYDINQVLLDDKVASRYTVLAGQRYVTVVTGLLGSTSIDGNITTTLPWGARINPVAKEWDPGTSKLAIINALLSAAGYDSLSFSETGRAIIRPYTSPLQRSTQYEYADDEVSLLVPEMTQELDLFDIPNRWVLTVSEPDRDPITASYTNTDPGSPTSTVNRRRTITDFRTEIEAADITTLQEKVKRLAFEASQVFEAVEFETGLMPIHSGNDVYQIRFGPFVVNAKYAEHSWSMTLQTGAKMKHRARRVVTV